MLRIMLQKIWHKKWMNLCLLLGCVLLIATVICFPLYKDAAYNRMLQDEFENELFETSRWPAVLRFSVTSQSRDKGEAIQKLENLMGTLYDSLGVKEKQTISHYYLLQTDAVSLMNRDDVSGISTRLGFMTDLEEHIRIVSGECYSGDGLTPDGAIEVVVSQACMVSQKLLVGETLAFDRVYDADGEPIRIYIKGVYVEDDNEDYYWQEHIGEKSGYCLMSEKLFRELFMGDYIEKYTLNGKIYALFDYQGIQYTDVPNIVEYTSYLTEKSMYRVATERPGYQNILEEYIKKETKIRATLTILQIPVLIMLAAFLFMISGQMYQMEKNEISVIKSRGSSGGQIFRLYLYQSIFLTLLGGILGVPLGMIFSRALGSARSFLEFTGVSRLTVHFGKEALVYTQAAMAAVLCIMTIPAIRHSKVSIVHLKQQNSVKRKYLWERLYLDVILTAVSLYGFYSFHKSEAQIEESVLMGESLDPLLYISSSLFILGLGLLFLRIQPYLVQLIYLLGKNHWKSASYASFMENRKNGRKQQFIMLFLILTISLGMYHATIARTILQNAIENAEYLDGADIIIKEVWSDNSSLASENPDVEFMYYEPDFGKYASLDCARSYTRVICDDQAYMTSGSRKKDIITLMGIHTREFGENTALDKQLLGKEYYELLNKLAIEEDGILVSANFRDKLGYKEGDSLSFYDNRKNPGTGKIVGFFDFFPGYAPVKMGLNPDGTAYSEDHYMVVAHYASLCQKWGVTPYEVWITLRGDSDSSEITGWLQEYGVKLSKYINRDKDIESAICDPLLQGTNGVLTMGFIVTILLCAVGYLIYWIMSVRSREMIFGVLRACGMHKGELIHMLLNEQIFSGVFSILAGVGIGKLTSKMYVPMVQIAYAASNQVLPMKLITDPADMLRLYGVILFVVVLCLAVLMALLFKLNITNTLKLGEE